MSKQQEPERVKGDCPSCGKDRWAHVRGSKIVSWDHDEEPVWARDTYRLLECAGCETVFFQHVSVFSEHVEFVGPDGRPELIPDVVYFPSLSKRDRPDWLHHLRAAAHDLYLLLDSLYTAIDHDLIILAASGVRTTFDLAIEKLGIDPAIAFEEKLEELKSQGRIGQYEQEDLTAMVGAGNAAMHRGWKPSDEELDTMMTTLERFVHHSFLLSSKTALLKSNVPPKQKRRPKSEAQ